jgi:predicted GH43/DUF377 family glycosyl hydrolase
MKKISGIELFLIMAVGLVGSANAAITIELVDDGSGYDEPSMSGFRSTGVAKSFDIDGDNIYGTAGTFFFGQGGNANINGQLFSRHTDNLPAWVNSPAAGTNFASVAEYDTYSPIDDPTLTPTNDVADWARSAVGLSTFGGVGAWSEIMTFTLDGTAPSAFRLGIMAGNEGSSDGRWDPTGLRLSVDGGTAVAITDLPVVNSTTVGMVFFNITTDGSVGTFSIEGQKRLSGQGPSLAGLTFDVSPDGVFPTLPEIEYFVVAHTETEGLGKAAWSVLNATSVSILNASNETVSGVSGLQGVADITYTSGDTFTLVAASNGVERTETQTIITTTTLEDEVTFTFDDCTVDSAPGDGVGRRDPSDVIKVGDTWHVWYSRMTNDVTTGYDASVWHATSTNSGYHWVEQAEAVPRGATTNDWDCTSTFAPNILFHDGTYYLYYTAVGPNFTQDYEEEGKTGIGVSTSSSPYGPWTKYAGNPVLIPSTDTSKFDSFRVDDPCMAARDGDVWLYYKGRPWGYSASYTKMGVAVATNGVGPFVKQNDGDPVQLGGDEVQIWADENEGVYSMVNGVGSADLTYTIQYASDGLNFTKYADISTDEPGAPGLFRWELTDPSRGCRPDWGVYGTSQLGRYEIDIPAPDITFSYSEVSGVGYESGIYRRDPSDIIKVDDIWHIWYSKPEGAKNGASTIWHATSTNAGLDWVEEGMALPRGTNSWDSDSAFTPNILLYEDTYYLYYTGVGPNHWEYSSEYSTNSMFRIGVASSDSPYGPWTKYAGNPILVPSTDTTKFDSYRVDDACLAVRNDQIWLYHKGRPWGLGPTQTKMGVVIADDPLGPFVRQNGGDPVQLGGHEVQIWMDPCEGVYSLVGSIGPDDLTYTLQYASDGMNFRFYADVSTSYPTAPGVYRTELTDRSAGGMPEWGTYGTEYLTYFTVDYNESIAPLIDLDPASIVEGNRMGDSVGALSVSGGDSYVFELLPIINTNDFVVGSAAVTANTVFDSAVTNQVGLFVRASLDDLTVDAYFDVDVLEASGIQGWRLDEFGADVLAQTNLESTVWGDDANPDGDAFSNADEYTADTLPQDSNSVLRVESLALDGSSLELSWIGGVQATQYIETCYALTSNSVWTVIATNLPPTAVSNVWSGTVPVETNSAMFRIKAVR